MRGCLHVRDVTRRANSSMLNPVQGIQPSKRTQRVLTSHICCQHTRYTSYSELSGGTQDCQVTMMTPAAGSVESPCRIFSVVGWTFGVPITYSSPEQRVSGIMTGLFLYSTRVIRRLGSYLLCILAKTLSNDGSKAELASIWALFAWAVRAGGAAIGYIICVLDPPSEPSCQCVLQCTCLRH